MIINTSMRKRDQFIHDVSIRLDPGMGGRFAVDRADDEGHEFIYLGGGHWRAIYCPSYKAEPIAGSAPSLSLINPDRTHGEIMLVEQGLAVLVRAMYDEARIGMMESKGCRHAWMRGLGEEESR